MIETVIRSTVDLNRGVQRTVLRDVFAEQDDQAHTIEIAVTRNGVPVSIDGGSVATYFVRARDNATVLAGGSVLDGKVVVTLPGACYSQAGSFSVAVRLTLGDQTHTVFYGTGSVLLTLTETIVDPDNVIPSLDDLLAQIDRMEAGTEAAQAAAQTANTAAGTANTAAQGANDAASAANTAASALNGLTATANTLEPDEPATAVAELVSGAWKITFGIPQGVQGIQGVRGTVAWHGTAITGTSTTPTAYPTGIDSAIAGDLYLYSGTDVANIGNVYTCTQGGDASTALWAYMANWRGATGAGSVSSVNSVLPNTDGDVELTAADVGALPNTYTPPVTSVNGRVGNVVNLCNATNSTSEQYGERVILDNGSGFTLSYSRDGRLMIYEKSVGEKNVFYGNKSEPPYPVTSVNGQTGVVQLDGLIYPTTAQALEAMSQEQQTELYTQGYRAIVATYNDTVTMHALASDGSIAWIGSNQDTTNLIDNPGFSIAQAGYGGRHGTRVYAADRWAQSDGSATYSQASSGGLSIQMSQAGHIYQKLDDTPSGNFTLAINVGGVNYVSSGAWPDGAGADGIGVDFSGGNIYADETYGVVIYFTSSCTIAHARMLRGSYTAKTLPPWEEPDYATELIKCQRYYIRFDTSGNDTNIILGNGIASSATTSHVVMPIPCKMRIVPSCTFSAGSVTMSDFTSVNPAISAVQVRNMAESQLFLTITVASGLSANMPVMIRIVVSGYIDFSADL